MSSEPWHPWGQAAESVAVIHAELLRALRSRAVVADECGVSERAGSPIDLGQHELARVEVQLASAEPSAAVNKVGRGRGRHG